MKLTGSCYCRKLRFTLTAAPFMKGQCHCRQCRYFTGGAVNYFAVFPADNFTYTSGTPQTFARTDIENPRTREFCPECGTHVATRRANDDKIVIIKIGTLNEQSVFNGPDMAVYTIDVEPYDHIPDDIPAFETLPPRK